MKAKRSKLCYPVLVLIIVFVSIFSGCINSSQSEIIKATSYIESANSRLEFLKSLDYKTVWVGYIRANASAAKSDFTESSNILNKIPLTDLNSQDQADLKGALVMVNVDIELCDLLGGPFSDFIDNFQTYSKTNDPGTAANSINSMKNALRDMDSSLGRMSGELNSVNENGLSPKVRADFVSVKSMILSLQESMSKAKNTFENTCTTKCLAGQVLGTDCQCHPACGSSYCSKNSQCCNGQCYTSCPSGYIMGNDCICHVKCGNNYCSSDATCCRGRCYTCPSGYSLGNDCMCH